MGPHTTGTISNLSGIVSFSSDVLSWHLVFSQKIDGFFFQFHGLICCDTCVSVSPRDTLKRRKTSVDAWPGAAVSSGDRPERYSR